MEIVSLKCDYCFKEWFSNETIRKYFISDVLDIPVENIRSVRLANPFLRKRYREQKQGILDVLVELNDDTKINIEMQTKFMSCWDKRDLFYLAKMYTEDLKVGERYSKLKRCVGISILDFNLTEDESYHRVYRLRDEKGYEFTNLLEVHIIELGKKLKGTEKVDDWIRLINAKSTEDLNMIGAKNVGMKTAIEEVKRMSLSKKLRLHYEAYLKEKRDAWAIEDYEKQQRQKKMQEAIEQGLTEGREQGLTEGREQGLTEGREQGLTEGRKQGLTEGREQGLTEGREQGFQEGELRGRAEIVIETLERFGEVPHDLKKIIYEVKDIDTLRNYLRCAVKAQNIEDFRNKIGK